MRPSSGADDAGLPRWHEWDATAAMLPRRPSPTPRTDAMHIDIDKASFLSLAAVSRGTDAVDRFKNTLDSPATHPRGLNVRAAIFVLCAAAVVLLTAGALFLWTFAVSGAAYIVSSPPAGPLQPLLLLPSISQPRHEQSPFPDGITGATNTHTDAHIVFLQPPELEHPSSGSNGTSEYDPPQFPQPLFAWAAINTTFTPASAGAIVAISIPPDTAASLHRIQIFGLDPSCAAPTSQCLCGPSATAAPVPGVLQRAASQLHTCPPSTCMGGVLTPLLLPAALVYEQTDWFALRLPCALTPGRRYTIEWLAAPDAAFLPSSPYFPTQATTGGSEMPSVALSAVLLDIAPSTVAQGHDGSTTRVTVTAPEGLTVLSSADEVEGSAVRKGGLRTVTFKPLRGISLDMIAVAVGDFMQLATGRDAVGRRVSVWALPGATPEDAQVPWQILSNATAAWAEFTGQPLPDLGKLDMLIWNGESPWSMAQHGLLLMDRFRTLWRGGVSTASDLMRCAHVICHETGHLWFGGLVQTLDTDGIAFIQESTTSYGEVDCVAKVLPGPLSETAAFSRSFFSEFGDTRAMHTGADFHATDTLARPELANDTVLTGSTAQYTKGPALLHMLGSYMDANIGKELMTRTFREFFQIFSGTAVTTHDLLCHLAHALAGCNNDSTHSHGSCAGPRHLHALDEDDIHLRPGDSCASVPLWLQRLQAWLEEPGVPTVELHQHLEAGRLEVQGKLVPNQLPGQMAPEQPLWIPISLANPALGSGQQTPTNNGTMNTQAWITITSPGPSYHTRSLDVESEAPGLCSDATAQGRQAACGHSEAGPPVPVTLNATAPWLPKPTAGPFLVSMPDKGTQAAVVRQLRRFKLTSAGHDVAGGHPDMAVLQAFSSLMHDATTLFRAAPTHARYGFLTDLLHAAFTAPAVSQSGLAAYLLLGPATAALWELHLLARGDGACMRAVSRLEAELLDGAGVAMWERLVASEIAGDESPDELTQDELFGRAIAARIVPRAVRYDVDLAAAVCELLVPPTRRDRLDAVLEVVSGPPEVQNIVLETAVVAPDSCKGSADVQQALLDWLQDREPELMPHLRRSAAFILAGSNDREVLEWLVDAAVLDLFEGVDAGLRSDDRVTLYQRIARSSAEGFRVAAERVQEYAVDVEEWEWEDVVPDIAPYTVKARDPALPQWLPLADMKVVKMRALVLEKQSGADAARIVCGRA